MNARERVREYLLEHPGSTILQVSMGTGLNLTSLRVRFQRFAKTGDVVRGGKVRNPMLRGPVMVDTWLAGEPTRNKWGPVDDLAPVQVVKAASSADRGIVAYALSRAPALQRTWMASA